MRTRLVVLFVIAVASRVTANGTIGIYFDQAYSQSSRDVHGWIPFEMYVILHDVDSGVSGVEYRLLLPVDLAIIGTQFAGSSPVALVGAHGTAVGFGSCELALAVTNHDYVIVTSYTVVVTPDFSAAQLRLEAYLNPQDQAAAPRWVDCGSGQNQQAYEVDQIDDAWLSAGVVANEHRSWGRIKRLYGR